SGDRLRSVRGGIPQARRRAESDRLFPFLEPDAAIGRILSLRDAARGAGGIQHLFGSRAFRLPDLSAREDVRRPPLSHRNYSTRLPGLRAQPLRAAEERGRRLPEALSVFCAGRRAAPAQNWAS